MVPLMIIMVVWLLTEGVTFSPAESNEIQIEKIDVRLSSQGPVVLLQVGERMIPIFVDPTVAGSIQGALTGHKFPRPLSHDLMHSILGAYGINVDRVLVTLKNGTYYGTLTLSQDGHTKIFDSRSSDAIALAVHFHTPILVNKELLESAGEDAGTMNEPTAGKVIL